MSTLSVEGLGKCYYLAPAVEEERVGIWEQARRLGDRFLRRDTRASTVNEFWALKRLQCAARQTRKSAQRTAGRLKSVNVARASYDVSGDAAHRAANVRPSPAV